MDTSAAPSAAEHIVELINTRYLADGDDVLADGRAPDWLRGWLGSPAGSPDRPADEGSLHRLRTLREGLRQLAAVNNGQPPQEREIAEAATALAADAFVLDLGDDRRPPGIAISPTATLPERAVARLAECYLTARGGKDWPRLKACAAPDCRYAYLDTSRNRSRRWCEMAYCGNRAKNRTWRARQVPAEDREAPAPAQAQS